MAAFGAGYAEVLILPDNEIDRRAVAAEVELAQAMLTGTRNSPSRVRVIEAIELCAAGDNAGRVSEPVLLVGGRRDITRVTANAMADNIEAPIPLPAGAPYGAVEIDSDKCTLCLACVSLCPTSALGDNPDRPEVRFTENACVQCGLCAATCPEGVITLEARYDTSAEAQRPIVLHSEEPALCTRCGKPFGTQSTINRITERLAGKHWMFRNPEQAALITMCDDCRIEAQWESAEGPFAAGGRPRIMTTDDYLQAEAKGLSVEDFLKN